MLFDSFLFNRKIRILQKEREECWDSYRSDLESAKNNKDEDKYQSILAEVYFFTDQIDEKIRWEQHIYVKSQAERFLIPFPEYNKDNGDWVQPLVNGRWMLSDECFYKLHKEVRAERRDRIELPLILPASIIGMLGGLVGIASALFK